MDRKSKILSCIDPATQIGIEVGALTRPIVTRQMGTIRYVDHETTENLRAKYAKNPSVNVDQIVDVDYVWSKNSLLDSTIDELPFDYLIASHVVEHVPDFISWFKEIRSVLRLDGIVSLAIPDKRRCFDYYRNVSVPADFIEAYICRSQKPSPRQIFDHFVSAVCWNGLIAWSEEPKESELSQVHSVVKALNAADASFKSNKYLDVHCWVFTPSSFVNLLNLLIKLDLFDFAVEKFYETEGCEFFVSLRALEVSPSAQRRQTQIESLSLIDPAPLRERSSYVEEAQKHIEHVSSQLQKSQSDLLEISRLIGLINR